MSASKMQGLQATIIAIEKNDPWLIKQKEYQEVKKNSNKQSRSPKT